MQSLKKAGIRPIHWHTPADREGVVLPPDVPVVIWLRNPFTRFVSAFNMSKTVIEQDVTGWQVEDVTLRTSVHPPATKRKIAGGRAFPQRYEELVGLFSSANELAEALDYPEPRKRRRAQELMASPRENVGRGIGWHLDNGDLVDEMKDQIAYVGRMESMSEDLKALSDRLGVPLRQRHVRRNRNPIMSTDLSPRAVNNLRHFYYQTDFGALRELRRYGWLSEQQLAEYEQFGPGP